MRLPGNPTTGYSWEVSGGVGGVAGLEGKGGYQPDPDPQGKVGSGGMFTAAFKVLAKGRTTLKFVYRRPWEKSFEPSRKFDLEVVTFSRKVHIDEKANRGGVLIPLGAEIVLSLLAEDDNLTQEMVRPKGSVAFLGSEFEVVARPHHLYRYRAEKPGDDEVRVRYRFDEGKRGPVAKIAKDYRVFVRVYQPWAGGTCIPVSQRRARLSSRGPEHINAL